MKITITTIFILILAASGFSQKKQPIPAGWAVSGDACDAIILKIAEILKVDPTADFKKRIHIEGATVGSGILANDRAVNIVRVYMPANKKTGDPKAYADATLAQLRTAIEPDLKELLRLEVDVTKNSETAMPTGETAYSSTPIHVYSNCGSYGCISTVTGGLQEYQKTSPYYGREKLASSTWQNY